MAIGTWSVVANTKRRDNTQVYEWWDGTLQWSGFSDTYPVGGADIKNVLLAALQPTGPLKSLLVWSSAGSGYVYDYIEATGKLMVLQVPPSGSLTTAAPMQQLGSGANAMSGVFQDTIRFRAQYVRNIGA